MDNKEIDSPIALQKKTWSTPNFYLLDTDNIHGGPNAGLHENLVVSSRSTSGGGHYIRTHSPVGAFQSHYVPGTHLQYNS